MNTTVRKPYTCERAIVIRRMPVADAKTLFGVAHCSVIRLDNFFYRGAFFSGYLLSTIPPQPYQSLTQPKTYLRVYLRWFSWRPKASETCRITLHSPVQIIGDEISEEVITDLGLLPRDAYLPP